MVSTARCTVLGVHMAYQNNQLDKSFLINPSGQYSSVQLCNALRKLPQVLKILQNIVRAGPYNLGQSILWTHFYSIGVAWYDMVTRNLKILGKVDFLSAHTLDVKNSRLQRAIVNCNVL